MTHSVTRVVCGDCLDSFSVVLRDLDNGVFRVDKNYTAECPNCHKATIFKGRVGIIDANIPEDAIAVGRAGALSDREPSF